MSKPHITIRELYPDLNDVELVEAEQVPDRYIELILRIHKRLEAEGKLSLLDEVNER